MISPELLNEQALKMNNHQTLSVSGIKSNIDFYENQILELDKKLSELRMKLVVEKTVLKNKQEKSS